MKRFALCFGLFALTVVTAVHFETPAQAGTYVSLYSLTKESVEAVPKPSLPGVLAVYKVAEDQRETARSTGFEACNMSGASHLHDPFHEPAGRRSFAVPWRA